MSLRYVVLVLQFDQIGWAYFGSVLDYWYSGCVRESV